MSLSWGRSWGHSWKVCFRLFRVQDIFKLTSWSCKNCKRDFGTYKVFFYLNSKTEFISHLIDLRITYSRDQMLKLLITQNLCKHWIVLKYLMKNVNAAALKTRL